MRREQGISELDHFGKRALEAAYPINGMPIIVHEAPLASPTGIPSALRTFLEHGIVPGKQAAEMDIAGGNVHSHHEEVYTKLITARGDKYQPGDIKHHLHTMSLLISPQFYFRNIEDIVPDERGAYTIRGKIPPDAISGIIIQSPIQTEIPRMRTTDWRKDGIEDHVYLQVEMDRDVLSQAVSEINSRRNGPFRRGPKVLQPKTDYRIIGQEDLSLDEVFYNIASGLLSNKILQPKKHSDIVGPIHAGGLLSYAFTRDAKITTSVNLLKVDWALEDGRTESVNNMLAFFYKTDQLGVLSGNGEACFSYVYKYLEEKGFFENQSDRKIKVSTRYPAILATPRERILSGWENVVAQGKRIKQAEEERDWEKRGVLSYLREIGQVMAEFDLPIPIFFSDGSLAWPLYMSSKELIEYKRKEHGRTHSR